MSQRIRTFTGLLKVFETTSSIYIWYRYPKKGQFSVGIAQLIASNIVEVTGAVRSHPTNKVTIQQQDFKKNIELYVISFWEYWGFKFLNSL